MSTIPPITYYVYVLTRPDGRPFYVGKGHGDRIHHHERDARRGHRCHKCNVIRKIWRSGGVVQRYILFTTTDEQEAFAYEQAIIEMYGRDTLCNHTDGGEGARGRVMPPTERIKRGKLIKLALHRPDVRAKHLAGIARSNADPEIIKRRAAGVRAAYQREDARTNKSKGMYKRYENPEERAKTGAIAKARWDDPAYRERLSAIAKARGNTPEERARRSERSKRLNADPERRRRASELSKKLWADPEWRARNNAAQKVAGQKRRKKS